MRYLIALILMLSSCGSGPTDVAGNPILRTNPEVPAPRVAQDYRAAPYLAEFESTYPVYTTANVPVIFEPASAFALNVVGYCFSSGRITINQDRWDSFSAERQRNLIWHELGHCLLRRAHSDETYADGCPKSIMHTHLIEDGCVAAHSEIRSELVINKGF